MPTPFAIQREPAGFRETPAVLQNNGGTAAGRVGVAVPLSLLRAWPLAASCLTAAGCVAHPCQNSFLPETMTVSTVFRHDPHGGGGWESESIGVSFTWGLRPQRIADPETDPKLFSSCRP